MTPSDAFDLRPRAATEAEHENRWRAENHAAIETINNFIEEHGLLASKLRYRAERE
jgi:post-segregation antitoxin (ccd killing protein)